MDILFRELVNEIILRLDKLSLFYAGQVSNEWQECCNRLVVKITTKSQFKKACKIGDILSISKCEIDEDWLYYHFRHACKPGHLELVKLLISRGANDWDSGLYRACRGGHLALAKFLIIKGTENPVYYDGELAEGNLDFIFGLRGACQGGQLELAYLMIAHGDDDWDNNLHYACLGGLRELVNLAITKGANEWNSGLSGACEGGQLEMAELMITKGANNLDCAFETACRSGQPELAQLMLREGARCLRTARRSRTHAQRLIDTSTDVKPTNHHLNIGLECACYYVNMKLINKYKGDPERMFNKSIRKPLGGSVVRGLRTIKLMIEKGAAECCCRKSIEEHEALCDKYFLAIQ